MTRDETAKKLGVSAEKVRQIEERALRKLGSPKFRTRWNEIRESIALLGYELEVSEKSIEKEIR